MSGLYLSLLAFALTFATIFRWFQLVRAVSLPKNRGIFLACMIVGVCLAVAGLMQEPGMIGVVSANLALLLGIFFLFTFSISTQKGGSGNLKIGSKLLSFAAPDHLGNNFESATLEGQPVLLKFFRGHW
jgi:hypothetical protein